MAILSVILSLLFIVIATAMILIILIQRPQGGGLTGAFGGSGMGASQTAFGAKTGDMLTWATVTVFLLFLLSAMGMVWLNKALYLSGKDTAPAAPSELAAEALSPTSIKLTWKDNSDNENEFIVERSPDGKTNWTTLITVEQDKTEFSDTNLTPDTQYFYLLRARNSVGPSEPTGAVSVRTLKEGEKKEEGAAGQGGDQETKPADEGAADTGTKEDTGGADTGGADTGGNTEDGATAEEKEDGSEPAPGDGG